MRVTLQETMMMAVMDITRQIHPDDPDIRISRSLKRSSPVMEGLCRISLSRKIDVKHKVALYSVQVEGSQPSDSIEVLRFATTIVVNKPRSAPGHNKTPFNATESSPQAFLRLQHFTEVSTSILIDVCNHLQEHSEYGIGETEYTEEQLAQFVVEEGTFYSPDLV